VPGFVAKLSVGHLHDRFHRGPRVILGQLGEDVAVIRKQFRVFEKFLERLWGLL